MSSTQAKPVNPSLPWMRPPWMNFWGTGLASHGCFEFDGERWAAVHNNACLVACRTDDPAIPPWWPVSTLPQLREILLLKPDSLLQTSVTQLRQISGRAMRDPRSSRICGVEIDLRWVALGLKNVRARGEVQIGSVRIGKGKMLVVNGPHWRVRVMSLRQGTVRNDDDWFPVPA